MSQVEFGSSPEEMSMPPQQLSQQAQQFDQSDLSGLSNSISTTDIKGEADLQQELLACHRGREQAQLLLHQTQEKLELAQQLIQRQDALNQSLQERIAKLEQDLQDKNEQLVQSHTDCDDLRGRLKRQQHHTSQLKAALERCLDAPTANSSKDLPMVESWAVAKLADEPMISSAELGEESMQPNLKDPLVQASITYESVKESWQKHLTKGDANNVVQMTPLTQAKTDIFESTQGTLDSSLLSSNADFADDCPSNLEPKLPTLESPSSSSNFHQSHYPPSLLLPQVDTPHFIQVLSEPVVSSTAPSEPAPLISSGVGSSPRKSITSLAAVKLPQFPPLRRQ